MKKSIILFTIIASAFVACEQTQIENIDYNNSDVYGTWARDYIDINKEEAKSIIFINDRNIEFISQDSLRIYHGYWNFTEISDLGYVEYKYEIIKNEELILTSYDPFNDTCITKKYQWSPNLSYIEENVLGHSLRILNIKGFLGKWEWVSTKNIENCSEKLQKHVIDTLENSIIEFKTNTFITHLVEAPATIENIYVTKMYPYTAIISKKDGNIIDNKVLPTIDFYQDNRELSFLFPVYRNNKFTDFLSGYGGTHYRFSIEDNKLFLLNDESKLLITFKKIE